MCQVQWRWKGLPKGTLMEVSASVSETLGRGGASVSMPVGEGRGLYYLPECGAEVAIHSTPVCMPASVAAVFMSGSLCAYVSVWSRQAAEASLRVPGFLGPHSKERVLPGSSCMAGP